MKCCFFNKLQPEADPSSGGDQPLAGNGRKLFMYTVYILRSLKNGKRYIGYTSKLSSMRLTEHNLGTNKWTKANRPFVAIYQEKFDSKTEAIQRGHFLKSGQGRKWLDSTLKK